MGGGVRSKAEKKIVSVGAISTFRHPLVEGVEDSGLNLF